MVDHSFQMSSIANNIICIYSAIGVPQIIQVIGPFSIETYGDLGDPWGPPL